ncbi:heptaprenyl diphosphate synthase [Limnochorda pilosa]|uniref:Heptaprenyl diphosphate synthase n=1 Tax=Limnochorda pilosa TaxID=1555112 RepID=A0A0K2SQ43_LIMPI|nr:heptaprenyl diphosphate synthase [Limnochorda pilosa]
MARLGMFLALGVALHVLEAQLPSLPLPGAKLGLANIVSLVALYLWGFREALLLVVLRQVLGSFVIGTLFSGPFWIGLAGGLVSVAVMAGVRAGAGRLLSPVGVSLMGAAAHNTGQLMAAWLLTGQGAVLAYLPVLLWLALPAGALVGLAAARVLAQVPPPPSGTRAGSGVGRGVSRAQIQPRVRHGDWAAAVLVAAVGAVLLWNTLVPATAAGAGPAVAVVTVGGREVLELPLDQEQAVPLTAGGVRMVLETAPGRVRVRASDCPDQICVRTGWIDRTHQAIACLPGRAVVRVRGGEPLPYDAITR